ncbi:hypothetical protein CRG98_015055 [Punica granatum]|uniref:Bifunctional inhibitor/plant lipid transfer protein/seed storage helical domain-containing protein n=1 Tax=Punica granatum TaxID=22663 RepID=A0A2I0K944_PUNGR|nr:hypothetical protein CRG98_015055 [Punica granatum]
MEGTHKIAGFVLNAALLLLFIGLVTRTEAAAVILGGNCGSVRTNISACSNLLGINLQIGSPSRECCVGLQNIAQAAVNLENATTCLCIRTIPQLLLVLPGLSLSFSIVRELI